MTAIRRDCQSFGAIPGSDGFASITKIARTAAELGVDVKTLNRWLAGDDD